MLALWATPLIDLAKPPIRELTVQGQSEREQAGGRNLREGPRWRPKSPVPKGGSRPWSRPFHLALLLSRSLQRHTQTKDHSTEGAGHRKTGSKDGDMEDLGLSENNRKLLQGNRMPR